MSTTENIVRPLDRILELERLLDENVEFQQDFASDPGGSLVTRSLDLELPVETGPKMLSELLSTVPTRSAASCLESVKMLLDDSAPVQPEAFWGAKTNGAMVAEIVANVGGYQEVLAAEDLGVGLVAVVVAVAGATLTGTPTEPKNANPHAMRLKFAEGFDTSKISYLEKGLNLSLARQRAILRRGTLEGRTVHSEFTEDGYEHKVVEFETDETQMRITAKVGIDDIIILNAEIITTQTAERGGLLIC